MFGDARLDGLKGRLAGQQRIAEPDLAGRKVNGVMRFSVVVLPEPFGPMRRGFSALHVNGEVNDRKKAPRSAWTRCSLNVVAIRRTSFSASRCAILRARSLFHFSWIGAAMVTMLFGRKSAHSRTAVQ